MQGSLSIIMRARTTNLTRDSATSNTLMRDNTNKDCSKALEGVLIVKETAKQATGRELQFVKWVASKLRAPHAPTENGRLTKKMENRSRKKVFIWVITNSGTGVSRLKPSRTSIPMRHLNLALDSTLEIQFQGCAFVDRVRKWLNEFHI